MRWLVAIALLCGSGCRLTSKWALDDPDYAAKYDRPYEDRGWGRHRRMAKQLVDARFLQDKTGVYLNGGAAHDPGAVGGEIGIVHYGEPWSAARIGLAGLVRENEQGFQAGIDAGLRAQVPSRFSPYIGIGGFAGYHKDSVTIEFGDDDANTPAFPTLPTSFEEEQQQSTDGGLAAIYPEIGSTFWFSGHAAFSTFGRYYVTTDGRDHDFWMAGIGLTFMLQPRTEEFASPTAPSTANIPEPFFHAEGSATIPASAEESSQDPETEDVPRPASFFVE